MQDRYTGDIGDYAKYGLLRALLPGRRLGVVWYLVPDEAHNGDGGHVRYLDHPEKWRSYDPELFDRLRLTVEQDRRSVAAIERSGLLHDAAFASERLGAQGLRPAERQRWRGAWFSRILDALADCDLVFADPDNGLYANESFDGRALTSHKRIPLHEASALAEGRTAVVYHHNTRRRGGHVEEIRYWLRQLPAGAAAIYWTATSCRTFFVINPSGEVGERAAAFAQRWAPHARLVGLDAAVDRSERA